MAGIKNDRRTLYTKKVIQDEFFVLLEQKELEKITVKELCEAADINRGTFYKYYNDIYDLYNKIEDELWESISSNIHLKDASQKDWMSKILATFKSNKNAVTMIIQKKSGNTLLNRLWDMIEEDSISQIKDIYKDISEEEAQLYLTFYVEGSIGMVLAWLEKYPEISVSKLTDMLKKNLLLLSN